MNQPTASYAFAATSGYDRLVAFSCTGRGFRPSCGGRRMADTAAQLVDRVLAEVSVRQCCSRSPSRCVIAWPTTRR